MIEFIFGFLACVGLIFFFVMHKNASYKDRNQTLITFDIPNEFLPVWQGLVQAYGVNTGLETIRALGLVTGQIQAGNVIEIRRDDRLIGIFGIKQNGNLLATTYIDLKGMDVGESGSALEEIKS